MDPKFRPVKYEVALYEMWEKKGFFSPKKGKPYTILMPPPNANASLHAGHGMYTVDDIMIRYKRLQGFASVWLPGLDHAGIETQFVYEKQLAKQGKSRMDFDRKTLYEDIYKFVEENSGLIYKQFRRLGFLADWGRSVYTLDKHVIHRVFETFKKMFEDKLVYRGNYLVNYCTHCGTTLAELEIQHIERTDPLYYVKYPFADDKKKNISVATVRPETIFVDTHLAVNPKDKRRNKLIGEKVLNPLTNHEMEIISDEFVDPKFGTGIVKLTPAHDPNDFEVAKKRGLPIIQAIDWTGRIMENGGKYAGLKVKRAREQVVADLKEKGLIEKIDTNYLHSVAVCYKCRRDLEPLVIPNWFIKVEDLKKPVIDVVKKEKVKFYPKKYKKQMLDWLDVMHDWPISRQNVWGIRIPVWYKVDRSSTNIWVWWIDKNKKLQQGPVGEFLKNRISLSEIEEGLQKVNAGAGSDESEYIVSLEKPKGDYLPETDTFDTWFSSGQWPLVTLKDDEFKTHFPTDMMGTLADILKFWISRMIMFSLYIRGEIPYKNVYLWSMVADAKGVKMSKSKGNVVNPIDLVDKYGADAFRASLIFGTTQGGKVNLGEDKIIGMRNYANKIWNIGRFIVMSRITNYELRINNSSRVILSGAKNPVNVHRDPSVSPQDDSKKILKKLLKEYETLEKKYHRYFDRFQFGKAFDETYEFLWHRYADYYIEQLKEEMRGGNMEVLVALEKVYSQTLRLVHPFMPFVTEAVWQQIHGKTNSILESHY